MYILCKYLVLMLLLYKTLFAENDNIILLKSSNVKLYLIENLYASTYYVTESILTHVTIQLFYINSEHRNICCVCIESNFSSLYSIKHCF